MSENDLNRPDREPEEPGYGDHPVQLQLSPVQRLGLQPWFIDYAKYPVVDRVCRAGFVARWAKEAQDLYHQRSDRLDADGRDVWSFLAKRLGMNAEHMRRYPDAEVNWESSNRPPPVPPQVLCCRVSWILRFLAHDLSPDTPSWIASSAHLLIRTYRPREIPEDAGGRVAFLNELEAYGYYLFFGSDQDSSSVNLDELKKVFHGKNQFKNIKNVYEAVLRIAEIVGSILKEKLFSEPDHVTQR